MDLGQPGFDRGKSPFTAAGMLVLLYPACRWFRTFKAEHRDSLLKYL